ncbi:MAG: TIGR00730 family Rossman fold protein [Planctomycetaceae bacterium]|nr:TIGR00730 family Rossman fold protein [Planctomycetaceae bacterium]
MSTCLPRRICAFCGSSTGHDPRDAEFAATFARLCVGQGTEIVYGGGSVGLMGVVADTALAAGGKVIGVIPEFLATRELLHEGLTELHVVSSMHTRKALMADLADGFVALPGGLGTFEELFEVLTWAQLGLHRKPVGLLNPRNYFEGFLMQVDRAISDGFCRPEHRELFVVDDDPMRLLSRMGTYQPPVLPKWVPAPPREDVT